MTRHPSYRQLGTFLGVYTPTTLTILGVIMYLRIGWLVGHLGPAQDGFVVWGAWSDDLAILKSATAPWRPAHQCVEPRRGLETVERHREEPTLERHPRIRPEKSPNRRAWHRKPGTRRHIVRAPVPEEVKEYRMRVRNEDGAVVSEEQIPVPEEWQEGPLFVVRRVL